MQFRVLSDVVGDERGDGDRVIVRGFVEVYGESAVGGVDEVDLHDDCC